MHRKLSLSLAVLSASAIALTGCAASTPDSGDGGDESLRIVMLLNDQFDPYYLTLVSGAEAKAEELGVEFEWQAPTTLDVASQTALLQSVAATKPDGIIMSALDADAMVAPMKQVMDSGVPIVTVDADVNDPSARLGTVKSNGIEAGIMAADAMAELLGGEGKVGYVGYIPGIQSVDVRLQGWTEQLAKHPGLENVGDEYAEADVSANVEKASALLAREPELRGIFTSWTNAVIGTAQAVQQAGRTDEVAVIGVDASPEQVDLLERGLIAALVAQKPFDMGGIAVEEIVEYVRDGVEPESEILLDFVVATQENMDDPEVRKYFYVDPEN